jgi:hypothetical protein
MGQVSLFLGTEFSWVFHDDGHLSVSLTQQSFAETLIDSLGLDFCGQSSFTTFIELVKVLTPFQLFPCLLQIAMC